ncbi:hypothetical protein ETAA8_47240 [Anatilimnocola aggregata]|uniref:Uncharacterized protein n=1 Tax=Anatilimnocola aggregata TaxID=2528021 RepID=A0A517YHC6_9BACT|nr:hypothetical protein [Anatilimnocola aggregata]QDU29609.1 hypothetical protein ETAA8_47240 [Anatilimnocola aggregata]
MTSPVDLLGMYLHLARTAAQRQRPLVRDRLLVLAAAIASDLQLPAIAACCRARVLEHNPGHLLQRWPTVAEASEYEEFSTLRRQLVRKYSPERAEQLMQSLKIEWHSERAAYYSDEEYAAALLGLTVDDLVRQYGMGGI